MATRDAVEHRVDRDLARALDPGEHLLLLDRDAELFIDAQDFGIDLVEAAELRLGLGRGVIIGVLIVDLGDVELGPVDLLHLQPGAIGLEPPFEHPLGLALLGGDEADRVLVEALGRELLLDVRGEAPLIILGQRLARFAVGDDFFVHAVRHWASSWSETDAQRRPRTALSDDAHVRLYPAMGVEQAFVVHAIRAHGETIGPSTASTMSARLISVTGRASA